MESALLHLSLFATKGDFDEGGEMKEAAQVPQVHQGAITFKKKKQT